MELPIHIDEQGNQWVLANIPAARTRMHRIFADEGTNTRLIPDSELNERIDAMGGDSPDMRFMTYVHDQNGYGMCNASATASAVETAHMQNGDPLVKLSGGDLYNRICGGSDQGSLLEDGLEESKNGIAEVTECPYLEWRRRSPGVTRKNNRVLEYFLAPTFEHCLSGVVQGFQLISGVMWYDNYTPNSEGWLPVGRGRPGGHAIHGIKGARKGSKRGIWHKNSWRPTWGLGGFFILPQDAYDVGEVGGWWLVRSVTSTSGEKLPTPTS